MKLVISAIALFLFCVKGICQKEKLLAELSEISCKCIDSIKISNKAKEEIAKEINRCIDLQTNIYQLTSQLANVDSLTKTAKEKDGKKQIEITVNRNEDSPEYKAAYYEIERYLMENCKAVKEKISSSDKENKKSFSEEALELYYKGIDESKKENYKKAIKYYERAVKIDPEFAFAWDNIGIAYRKLGEYDKALDAYNKSLSIDPTGLMPLQNIAIVYRFKKEYDKAIEAYERLAELDKDNPEIYFGKGQIYTAYLNDHEKGLDNMCKAYNLYIQQKSPYRTDAEKIINIIYAEMKKGGKEERFFEILKLHNISPR
ncbi:tetratricopeptide repeat protein [Terrimonas alba]|uniref:tetratricopeptide repeat protein n=1 Tax=Terrimonas alba TaxID=3349636 RepID=UPI0035F3C832